MSWADHFDPDDFLESLKSEDEAKTTAHHSELLKEIVYETSKTFAPLRINGLPLSVGEQLDTNKPPAAPLHFVSSFRGDRNAFGYDRNAEGLVAQSDEENDRFMTDVFKMVLEFGAEQTKKETEGLFNEEVDTAFRYVTAEDDCSPHENDLRYLVLGCYDLEDLSFNLLPDRGSIFVEPWRKLVDNCKDTNDKINFIIRFLDRECKNGETSCLYRKIFPYVKRCGSVSVSNSIVELVTKFPHFDTSKENMQNIIDILVENIETVSRLGKKSRASFQNLLSQHQQRRNASSTESDSHDSSCTSDAESVSDNDNDNDGRQDPSPPRRGFFDEPPKLAETSTRSVWQDVEMEADVCIVCLLCEQFANQAKVFESTDLFDRKFNLLFPSSDNRRNVCLFSLSDDKTVSEEFGFFSDDVDLSKNILNLKCLQNFQFCNIFKMLEKYRIVSTKDALFPWTVVKD